MSCLNAGYLDSLAFVSLLVNTSNILRYSESFLGYLQPKSFNTKSTHAKNVYIKGAFEGNTSANNVYIGKKCIKNTSIGIAYINITGIIKRLKIHLQSFWILEIKNARLEIQKEVGYICIKNAYIKHASTESVYIRGIYLCNIYIKIACIKGVGTVQGTYAWNNCIKSGFIDSNISTIKCL